MIKTKTKGIFLIISFLSTLAFNCNMGNAITAYSTNGIQESGRNMISIVLFIMLYKFYCTIWAKRDTESASTRKPVCCLLPAFLFATFMVLGYSFAQSGNWELVLSSNNKLQIVTAFLYWLGYLGFFFFITMYLFSLVDRTSIIGHDDKLPFHPLQAYCNCLKKRPFVTSFLTLLIAYIPYMVLSYPAIFMSDTHTQILQGYNLPEGVPAYMDLSSSQVKWNNHHPVVHTLLIHICIRLGVAVFSSYNIGIFLFALLQAISIWAVVSMLIKTLIEKRISAKIATITLLYFIISPWVQNYTFLITKDVFYSVFLLLFLIMLFRLTNEPFSCKTCGLLVFASLGLMVFRNDGKYLVLLTLLCCLFLLKHIRKQLCIMAIGILLFSILLNNVLYPILQIEPGSKRELLSIPFQQTARYMRDIGDGVTEEEKAAISAVLDYDYIMTHYNPEVSDGVKETFNENATTEELVAYFKVWLQMFFKHPGIYIQATMHNVYSYFYPEYYAWPTGSPHYDSYEWSQMVMELTNTANAELPANFHYPSAFDSIRTGYELFRETVASFPIFSALVTPAFYVWLCILWLFYCIRERTSKGAVCLIPLLIVILICIASPVNGWYTRYIFPIAFCMPCMLLCGLWNIKQTE